MAKPTNPDDIRATYRAALGAIRDQRHVHPQTKQVEAARLYTQARRALAAARAELLDHDARRWDALERQLWGRAASMDGSDSVALRDAHDRAARIKKADEAARLLRQAEQTGDHVLAAAVAQHANERDWYDVLSAYLDKRPAAAEVYDEMCQIHARRKNGLATGMQYALAKPEELRGLADTDIDQMAADMPETAA